MEFTCNKCDGPVEVKFVTEQDFTGRLLARVDRIERDCKCVWTDKEEADFVDYCEENSTPDPFD